MINLEVCILCRFTLFQSFEIACISYNYVLQVDPFHTLFGIAGLSLLGHTSIKQVDPVYCLPSETVDRIKVKAHLL